VASAIFSTGAGRDVAVYIDGEVEPGVRLAEVHPDHVIVSRAGVRGRIDLEAPRGTAVAARGMPGRATGFKLNVARTGSNNYSLSRKELDDALRDPGQLSFLGQIGTPPKGGVRMELAPPGSLAQKLGLQPGDVIKKLNGQPVASAGDLARGGRAEEARDRGEIDRRLRGRGSGERCGRDEHPRPVRRLPGEHEHEGDHEQVAREAGLRLRFRGRCHYPILGPGELVEIDIEVAPRVVGERMFLEADHPRLDEDGVAQEGIHAPRSVHPEDVDHMAI